MQTIQSLERVTILGEKTRHWSVQASGGHSESWLQDAPVCPELAHYGMVHLGVVEAYRPYRFTRPVCLATEMLACFGGCGMVLIDGNWTRFEEGKAVLMPQHCAIGYYSAGDEPWKLVWVCYQETGNKSSIITPSSPVMAECDSTLLLHTVEGLRLECGSVGDPACVQSWVRLVHSLVLRFAQPWQREDQLQLRWEKVVPDLAFKWTLELLSAKIGCGPELLRQRCQKQLGRSPMQHLTFLRMQRAAELLFSTDEKVARIAEQVGYSDPFAFSVAFKKWTGCPPSEFRELRRQNVK
jgi:AraC-like DNA-binding protein